MFFNAQDKGSPREMNNSNSNEKKPTKSSLNNTTANLANQLQPVFSNKDGNADIALS